MDDCVLWHQSVGGHGYGQTFHNGKVSYAHRVAWEKAFGPIPGGMLVHHKCGNRPCVNVDHMELMTRQDHMGWRGHGKLNKQQAEEIRQLVADGWRRQDVAEAYGIKCGYVGDIVRKEAWA
jgi:hypothetical protein